VIGEPKVASPLPANSGSCACASRLSDMVKGFGCRPVVTYLRALRAGVRKPPRKEPAGAGRQLAVYGDLTIRRRLRRPAHPQRKPPHRRSLWRVCRRRGSLQGDFSVIDGIGRAVGGGGATATPEADLPAQAGGAMRR